MNYTALLALEDGNLFYGDSVGISGTAVGEVVFNTAITGYQEILSDPSYCQQIVTLTHPHVGNVGCNVEDDESGGVSVSALVIRDLPVEASSWRCSESLPGYLRRHGVVAIAGVDSRRLTRLLRDKGALKGCVVSSECAPETAVSRAKGYAGLVGVDLAQVVSTKDRYVWQQGDWSLGQGFVDVPAEKDALHVLVYDFGVKRNMLRLLAKAGCRLTVVPARTSASEVLAEQPDGVFLSNGPGDPEPCDYAIEAIYELAKRGLPMFGICLGHQLLALAMGAKTVKMRFGHHGANHPVQCLRSGRVMISSQNHGFTVDEGSLPDGLEATHRSLFDGSLQGIRHCDLPVFGFQGHPEGSPGPHEGRGLFGDFVDLMRADGG